MSVSKQLIDNVNKIKTTLNEISVYNLDVKTAIELYYELAKKVNEVINELSRFEGVVSDEVIKQNEKLIYLLGEGLKVQVGLKIDELIKDGTIQDLINNKIFNELNNKIDTFKQEIDEQLISKASKTINSLTIYVDNLNGDDLNDGSIDKPFKTIQKAIDSIPVIITNDVEILVKAGTYIENSGLDEWGRSICLNFYGKNINPKRNIDNLDNTIKGGKITIKGVRDENNNILTILDGNNKNIRTCIYGHNTKNVYIRDIIIQNFENGVISHEGGDITLKNSIVKGCTNGLVSENDSKLELAYCDVRENTTGFYLKNGQLQINNSNIKDNSNALKIEGSPYVLIEDCIGNGLNTGDFIVSKGCNYMRIKGGEFGGGYNFLKGTINHLEINSGTYIHDFSSYVFSPQGGFWDINKAHIYNNNFVIYNTEGNPNVRMNNCDSKNKEGIDIPNTQTTPIRMNGGGTLQTTGTTILPYKITYNPPTDFPILYGSTPPTTGYHFKGKVMFNIAPVSGSPMGWVCSVAGVPGTWIPLPNLP